MYECQTCSYAYDACHQYVYEHMMLARDTRHPSARFTHHADPLRYSWAVKKPIKPLCLPDAPPAATSETQTNFVSRAFSSTFFCRLFHRFELGARTREYFVLRLLFSLKMRNLRLKVLAVRLAVCNLSFCYEGSLRYRRRSKSIDNISVLSARATLLERADSPSPRSLLRP